MQHGRQVHFDDEVRFSFVARMLTHPIQRRFAAEDLVRRRRSDEQARTASSQRQGRIDPNPHQVDAVMFALARIIHDSAAVWS